MKTRSVLILAQILAIVSALENKTLVEFTSGNNLLTSDIYKELTESFDGNFLVSPFSVQTALALTQSGAKGSTAEEIRKSLRLPNSKEETGLVFEDLLPRMRSEQFVLESANKIYVKEKYPIRDEFKKTALEVYHSDWENVNFAEKEEAARKINDWVEQKTKDKIHDIVSPDEFDEETRLVLINALYFRGNWSVPFKKISTAPKDFHRSENKVVQVETMHSTKNYNYYECSRVDAKFLELRFSGGEASMVIVLPNSKNGIKNLESKIDQVFQPRDFKEELVVVALPKFKIETTIDFVNILKKLGVRKIFEAEESDLSGISTTNETLIVSSIRQKTFIDVSEQEVEAAAATVVHVPVPVSAPVMMTPKIPKYFVADHPFIFYVKVRGVVLFGGRFSS